MTNQQSPLDSVRAIVHGLVDTGHSNREIVDHLHNTQGISTSERSVRRALRRWGIERPTVVQAKASLKMTGDNAEVTSPPTEGKVDHEVMIKERGLKPEEWVIDQLTVNEWDGASGEKMQQLKACLKRKKPENIVYPARTPGEYIRVKPAPREITSEEPKLVVFVGDQQAPYYDEKLHEKFLFWLDENSPDEVVLIGDTIDCPDISRHRNNPEWIASTQECIDAGYLLLKDYVQCAPHAKFVKLAGNHDERIRNTLIDHMRDLYGIRRAKDGDEEERSVLGMTNLLRLDELGIEFIDPEGSYEHAQHRVSKYLAARHGWLVRKGSGNTALATLEHLGYSIVVGHTHRQSMVYKTSHSIEGQPTTLTAVETGCMCKIEGGMGYAVAPDWQNGFATASVWPDNTFKLDLATFLEDSLYWQDQRY